MVESGLYKRKPDDVIALQIPFFDKMELKDIDKAVQEIIKFLPRGHNVVRYNNSIEITYFKKDEKVCVPAKCGDVIIKRIDDEKDWGIWPELTFVRFYELVDPNFYNIAQDGSLTVRNDKGIKW